MIADAANAQNTPLGTAGICFKTFLWVLCEEHFVMKQIVARTPDMYRESTAVVFIGAVARLT